MGRDCMWELCKGGWAWGLKWSSRVRWCFLFRKTQSQGLFWACVREKLKLSHGLCIKNCNPEFGSVCSEDTVVLFLIGMSWLFSGPLLSWSYNTIAFSSLFIFFHCDSVFVLWDTMATDTEVMSCEFVGSVLKKMSHNSLSVLLRDCLALGGCLGWGWGAEREQRAAWCVPFCAWLCLQNGPNGSFYKLNKELKLIVVVTEVV